MPHKGDRIKILVVEDEGDHAALLEAYLSKHGYSVSVAGDGQEAWLSVQEDRPDLITLDYMMPSQTGIRFFENLRGSVELATIPIVLVTGITLAGTKSKNLFWSSRRFSPPEAYLEKPVDEQDLIGTIRSLVGRKRESVRQSSLC